jgi:nicotinamidase-related amidase
LLIIDVINPFDFPGGAAFAERALPAAGMIDRLRTRASFARVPVIYVNDNFGKWRSDMRALVTFCRRPGMRGARIVDRLKPRSTDYVVLKSTLSGFYQTPLEAMLRLGGVRRLIVTGFATDNCVLFTAADAYMRDFRLVVPRDCVHAETPEAQRRALRILSRLLSADVRPSRQIRLSASR